jgi:hypothetical protein
MQGGQRMRYWGMTAPEVVLWVIGTVLCIM